MELEKMISETQELSQRFFEEIVPWESNLLVMHLAAVVGRLADDVMTIEGKLAHPVENVRFARNIADAILQLFRISIAYGIDFEQAWKDILVEARTGLDNKAFVNMARETIRQNLERGQQG
jgi:hypothetical protein